jgi:hypothetical protein
LAASQANYKTSKAQIVELQVKRKEALIKAGGARKQLSAIYDKIYDIQGTIVDLNLRLTSEKAQLGYANDYVAAQTLRLNTCKQGGYVTDDRRGTWSSYSGTIVNDATCNLAQAAGVVPTIGSGRISYVGPDYVVVNGIKAYLGKCSSRVYRSGHNRFYP